MSASAGKVMPRPMGDYNALTEYKVLDIVTYNDRPYMAKQTTTGNLPTNTTYWMLLLDFPTEVDNAPTQNSPNLVTSGGVYTYGANKLETDLSNTDNLILGAIEDNSGGLTFDTISKDAGANQTVTFTSDGYAAPLANYYLALYTSHIGDENFYYVPSGTTKVYLIIDSVSLSGTLVTGTGHLKVDDTAAISLTNKYIYWKNYVKANKKRNYVNGKGCSSSVDNASVSGESCVVTGADAHAEGYRAVAQGDYSHAEGSGIATANYAHAEGRECIASAMYAHAEGDKTVASGQYSHATGRGTVASVGGQFVCGYYNNNKATNAFEIGDGSSTTPHNLFEIDELGYISQNDGTDKYKFAKSGGADGYYDTSKTFHRFEPLYLEQNVTLSTSQDVTVTFSNAAITSNSRIEPWVSVWGIVPKDVVASNGSCVVTLGKASSADTIKVGIEVK